MQTGSICPSVHVLGAALAEGLVERFSAIEGYYAIEIQREDEGELNRRVASWREQATC